jgi:Na+/proline symporter
MTHQLGGLDYAVILFFFIIIFSIAALYARRAGKDTGQFFLSGRNLPWYIAGTAMVATTFAADTPLAVTEIVAEKGIAGNWLWWNMAIGGMLTVFFFARLWRRSGIMTDVEFVEFRYSGRVAAVLRGFRALYLGLFMNAIVMGWVNKAMEKIFHVTLPRWDPFLLLVIAAVIIAVYASASGLVGTARTDSFQFMFAMIGCIILAVIVIRLPSIGGTSGLKQHLDPGTLSFFPRLGKSGIQTAAGGVLALSVGAFIAHVGLQWWSSWYPGADPGGGGYVAQRMMSAKDEKHSLFATLWFNIAHYTLRPWPWILVALSALVLLPRESDLKVLEKENPVLYERVETAYKNRENVLTGGENGYDDEFLAFYERYENTKDPGVMYPKLMVKYLPSGLLGLLLAVFLAAYMSTMASQLNWGTSYLVNDFYRRFIRPSAPEKHYVLVSRAGICLMVVFSLVLTRFVLTTIKGAWEFIINASAGLGGVLILRWYWWRINAWSEISAMTAPLIIYPVTVYVFGMKFPNTLYPTVLGTTVIWVIVTFLTRPVRDSVLEAFYRKVHPGGIGWRPFTRRFPEVKADRGLGHMIMDWIAGVVLIYASLFSIGRFIFHQYLEGILFMILAGAAAVFINLDLRRGGFQTLIR